MSLQTIIALSIVALAGSILVRRILLECKAWLHPESSGASNCGSCHACPRNAPGRSDSNAPQIVTLTVQNHLRRGPQDHRQ